MSIEQDISATLPATPPESRRFPRRVTGEPINTVAEIKALMPGCVKERRRIKDARGLYIEQTPPSSENPKGLKTWVFRYSFLAKLDDLTERKVGQEMVLGHFPAVGLEEARGLAAQHRKLVKEGQSPKDIRETTRQAHILERVQAKAKANADAFTVGAMAVAFIERYCERELRDKTRKEYARVLIPTSKQKDYLSGIRDKPAALVTPSDVRDIVNAIRSDAPVQARRAYAALSSCYAWAADPYEHKGGKALVGVNPCAGALRARKRGGVQRQAETVSRRTHTLNVPEVTALMRGLPAGMPEDIARAIEVMLRTGQRPGEVLGMTWEEVDPVTGTWTIPADRYKTGKPHVVLLPPQVLRLLGARQSGYVFARQRRDRELAPMRADVSIHHYQLALKALEIRPATQHDLRRTAETLMHQELHIDADLIHHGITGHARPGLQGTYQQADLTRPAGVALKQWNDWLDSLKVSNVIAIHGSERPA